MPRKKALKVIVDIHFHAITCPGVFLPEQQDVFLNVEALGQRKRSESTPPVFPFLFHEKLRFEKVFSHATDPVQVASALSGETVRIELVQLTYPGGELLATYEDNAREFLFPTPRISPTYPGVDREVLLQRSSAFPGIAPKLEFSSRTIIKEVTSISGSGHSRRKKERPQSSETDLYGHKKSSYPEFNHSPIEASTPHVQPQRTSMSSSTKKKSSKPSYTPSSRQRVGRSNRRSASLSRETAHKGYEQSTIASRARSPSPYTRRRMAQLSVQDPFDSTVKNKPFKTELEDRPEFVVRKAAEDTLSPNKAPPPLPHVSPSPDRRRRTPSPRNSSYSPGRRKPTPGKHLSDHVTRDIDSEDTADLIDSSLHQRPSRPTSAQSAPESISYRTPRRDLSFSKADDYDEPSNVRRSKLTPGSILFRTPLRERFGTDEPSPYEKIRDRVRDLLRSPRATQIVDDSISEANERYWARRSRTPSPRSPRSSVTVRLGADSYWNERASEYTGQSHRRVFEHSMDKMYDDIYHNIRSSDP
uniref:Spermatogenesis-associated protein 6 n=1 Tax=Phallusia mammillata TaxID=59560 RepID=A0A6F9DTL8_9ASCI|nr:spermatogenesis-associated protein 6 [Phallusia mammillata]